MPEKTLLPDFELRSAGALSAQCRQHGLHSFYEAAAFVKQLPYGRNADKTSPGALFNEGCGTCSTKHAFLKQLAIENAETNIRLVMGLFRMNGSNTPAVANRLLQHGLDFIPEAHCYLKFSERVFDFTLPDPKRFEFEAELIEETEILPQQITAYKVHYHKTYLSAWLGRQPHLSITPDELWTLREQCIRDISQASS